MILAIIFIGTILILAYFLYPRSNKVNKLDVPKTGYYGAGSPKPDDNAIHPFKIEVPEADLEDLRDRLKNARIGHKQLEDVHDFEYGFNLKTLQEYRDYWLNEYDWRKQEKLLNSFNHFTTQIEGLKIHFIHQHPPEGKYKKVIPLLIVHGWPGNVFEFYKIIPKLTDPNANGVDSDIAFSVIAPSIPGFGWSEQPQKSGFNQVVTGRVFHKLMTERLGYSKFMAQGGDWGASVVSNLAKMFPESVYGVHLNMILMVLNLKLKNILLHILGSYFPSYFFSDSEFANFSYKKSLFAFIKETGYMHIQATKPDTVGVSLNDSPIGLLAYIVEKFSTWTNTSFRNETDGGLERKFTKDELITIIMIYWLNQNIVSSQRYYKEFWAASPEYMQVVGQYLSVPTGFAHSKYEFFGPNATPREIAKLQYNIQQYTLLKDGGHFAAFELPEELAKDVFKFTRKVVS